MGREYEGCETIGLWLGQRSRCERASSDLGLLKLGKSCYRKPYNVNKISKDNGLLVFCMEQGFNC